MRKLILLTISWVFLIGIQAQNSIEIEGNDTDANGNISHSIVSISNHNFSRFKTEAFSNIHHRNGQIIGIRARGTQDNPTNPQPGDRIFGSYGLIYYDGEVITPSTSIEHYVGSQTKSGLLLFRTLDPTKSTREERMRINEFGNVGIGTETPNSKLQIADGDIYISDINKGVIMKSPNGNCWRLTVDNNGNPVFNPITCP